MSQKKEAWFFLKKIAYNSRRKQSSVNYYRKDKEYRWISIDISSYVSSGAREQYLRANFILAICVSWRGRPTLSMLWSATKPYCKPLYKISCLEYY